MEKPKLQLRRPTQDNKTEALAAAESLIEEGRNKAGSDSKPWQLVSPRDKVSINARISAPVNEKLDYVHRRHPQKIKKGELIELALEAYLDQMITEIDG